MAKNDVQSPIGLKTVVDRDGMLGDERCRPGIRREPLDRPGPHAMTHAERRADEVDNAAGPRIEGRRRVFFCPPVVVLGNRVEDPIPPRQGRERDAVLHDPAREMRVIGLRDQLDDVRTGADDQFSSPSSQDTFAIAQATSARPRLAACLRAPMPAGRRRHFQSAPG